MENVITIPLSKKKILLLLMGSIFIVVLGLCFTAKPEMFVSLLIRSSEIIRIIGIFAVLFFGTAAILAIKKLFDNQAGLIIGNEGIIDNSSATSVGLINWEDIREIKSIQIASTKLLLIMTDKSEKYIAQGNNILSRKALKANNSLYGSPLAIASVSLKMKFEVLEKLITQEFKKRRQ